MEDWSIYVGIVITVIGGLLLRAALGSQNSQSIAPVVAAFVLIGVGLLIVVVSALALLRP